jgi:mono/diheme cytochrome c family protein
MKKRTWLAIGAIVGLITVLAACGAQATSTPSGPSRAEQVSAGQEVYASNCASCHGENLQGVDAPALNASTLARFSTAAGIYDYISQQMPLGAPGSLSETQYYQVEAYILDENGLLPTGEALTPDNAPNISLSQ